MNNRLPNSQPRTTDERTVSIDVAAVVAELNDASEALGRVAAHLERAGNGGQAPGNGRAAPTSVGNRLTTKQLGAIHVISRKAGLSRDELAKLLFDLTGRDDPALLSRTDASSVIDRLANLAD